MARTSNAIRNSLRPGYAAVMARKVLRRLSPSERTRREATEWAAAHRVDPRRWCESIDAALASEAWSFAREVHERAERIGNETGVALGGGARVPLLYFVTRLLKPAVVVETGVAAGYSSTAFLTAMARNGHGRLYSSDFPYFRSQDPERSIGVLVPDELRGEWTLRVRGDEHNLPEILAAVDHIDLFHYDSDKSYAGRRRSLRLVEPKLAPRAAVLMDDINDNLFFRDEVEGRAQPFLVFGRGDYCVGAWGLPPLRSDATTPTDGTA